MNNGTLLSTTLIITVAIGVLIQIVLYKQRKNQKAAYPILWKKFEASIKRHDYADIMALGNAIIYNKFVQNEHLEIIQKVAKDLELKNSEFKKLRLDAYDKWIHLSKGRGYGY